jgi:methylated-DNA-protein-cysteine methyltransferase-like protein
MLNRHHPDPDTFNPIVWEIVRQIPRSRVTTFGQIASMIPAPNDIDAAEYIKVSPRWVGDAMNAVSFIDEPTVPWHRVINAKGGISLPENSVSALLQRERLLAEGVTFDKKDLIDLDTFGWDGPDAAWVEVQGLLPPKPIKTKKEDGGQMKLF